MNAFARVRLQHARRRLTLSACAATLLSALVAAPSPALAQGWEPTRTVEFIVPAGTGGGADQMARFIQGVIQKNNLMKQPLVVVNKGGGAGAEGFLDIKNSKGDPHKIVITLSNLFTTPLATGVPFDWTDLTPVSMMALDQFVLWVNAKSPYKTAKEYIEAVRAAGGKMRMGGTGSRQEDQIITVSITRATGARFTYIPFKGGGEVATQLVGGHVDSTVNNPIEAVAQWRAGALRPLCVFDDERMPYKARVTDTMAWSDIPTCREAGVPTDYVMLRGIFMAGGVTPAQRDFYVNLMRRIRETPEWRRFMEEGAFNTTALSGEPFVEWLKRAKEEHRALMKEAGFLK
ncbi:MAG: Bug family tripartite tricarboxylate transporter substrate binding protein [Pseudomonadota bacterium]|jgi:tripartite-type tricarboxylate transporter receptor subunit TctC